MTRGKLVLITKRGIYSSVEFNGDMMFDKSDDYCAHGREVVFLLEKVKSLSDFKKALLKFNDRHFGYNLNKDDVCYLKPDLDLREATYFKNYNWFSDYIYFKNNTDEDVYITNFRGKKYPLHPNEIAIYCFGRKLRYKI